jgi:drug/metabolite transporter (DMT)-like permease
MVLSLLLQGIMCSGVAYYVQGIVIKDRGPVFVTAFSPLCMILVTVLGSFILSEVVTLGRYVYVSDPRSTTFIHH